MCPLKALIFRNGREIRGFLLKKLTTWFALNPYELRESINRKVVF